MQTRQGILRPGFDHGGGTVQSLPEMDVNSGLETGFVEDLLVLPTADSEAEQFRFDCRFGLFLEGGGALGSFDVLGRFCGGVCLLPGSGVGSRQSRRSGNALGLVAVAAVVVLGHKQLGKSLGQRQHPPDGPSPRTSIGPLPLRIFQPRRRRPSASTDSDSSARIQIRQKLILPRHRHLRPVVPHPPPIHVIAPRLANPGQQLGSGAGRRGEIPQDPKSVGVQPDGSAGVGFVGGCGFVHVDGEGFGHVWICFRGGVVDAVEAQGQDQAADASADDDDGMVFRGGGVVVGGSGGEWRGDCGCGCGVIVAAILGRFRVGDWFGCCW
mmetsp:Transcript_14149/g.27540  ORF Transcript_14149/g.27540 Transcript_14149/m.27540 type:complete len:325 (-) Transcript_14149:133-1107(-)